MKFVHITAFDEGITAPTLHEAESIDALLVQWALKTAQEEPDVDYAAKVDELRNQFGLNPEINPRQAGNYLDGDSSHAEVIIQLDPYRAYPDPAIHPRFYA